jgi:hypothetical protein
MSSATSEAATRVTQGVIGAFPKVTPGIVRTETDSSNRRSRTIRHYYTSAFAQEVAQVKWLDAWLSTARSANNIQSAAYGILVDRISTSLTVEPSEAGRVKTKSSGQ